MPCFCQMDDVLEQPRLLILGGGAVVSEFFLPALSRLNLRPSVKVIECSPRAASSLRGRFPGVEVEEADFRHVLTEEGLHRRFDAAVVALPNWLHAEAITKALEGGLHVLAEKPLASTRDTCLRLADEAEKAHRVLAVNMTHRLFPSVLALHAACHNGLIGDITSVDIEHGFRYAWSSESGAFFTKEGGGILPNMGVHYLDFAECLLGELAPLQYEDDAQGGVEASVLFLLKSKDKGIPVRLSMSYSRALRNTIIVQGARGKLILGVDDVGHCTWCSADAQLDARISLSNPFSGRGWPLSLEGCFAEQLRNFILAFQHGRPPYTTARQAAAVIGLIEWAHQERSRRVVTPAAPPAVGRGPAAASVVVTGGTGFIGSQLVKRLSELGHQSIVVPVRQYQTCAEVARFPVTLPLINLLDFEAVKSVMKGAQSVFHCAYGQSGPDAVRVTIEGTKHVVEAAIACGCESVVVLSSAVVFGYPEHAVVDETWPYHPRREPYALSKARMEQWCLRRAKTSGKARIVVLNPTCVYGPHGKTFTTAPLLWAQEGMFCWIDDGCGKANVVYIDNLIEAMLLAARSPASGERFIISDGDITWREFLTPLLCGWAEKVPSYTSQELDQLHRRCPRPGVPDLARAIIADQQIVSIVKEMPLSRAVIAAAETWAPHVLEKVRRLKNNHAFHGPSRPAEQGTRLPPRWLADLFGSTATTFSSQKARRALNWHPRVSMEEGLRITAEWLKSTYLV